MTDARLLKRWVWATWGGWVLGVPMIALFALIGEGMGIGGSQVLVGAGMGAAIGLTQGRVIKGLFGRFVPWFTASTLGLAAPFLVTDLAPHFGWPLEYSLYKAVLCGGIVVGIWQALLLRTHVRMPALWVPAAAAAWSLAGLTAWFSDTLTKGHSLRGVWGALAYLGLLAFGGLVIGLITGPALVWMTSERKGDPE